MTTPPTIPFEFASRFVDYLRESLADTPISEPIVLKLQVGEQFTPEVIEMSRVDAEQVVALLGSGLAMKEAEHD